MSAALVIERDVPRRQAWSGDAQRQQRIEIGEALSALQIGDSFAVEVCSVTDPMRFRGYCQYFARRHPEVRLETGRCPLAPTKYRIWRIA